jgi:uncharacterized protein
MEPPPEFWHAIDQFNQRQFYDCHDTLEAIWNEAPECDRRFYQGLLQIAVACYHLSNCNVSGAMMLLGDGVSRLQSYMPQHYGVQVEALIQESLVVLDQLQTLSLAPDRPINLRSPDLTSDWAKHVQQIPIPSIWRG